MMNAVFHPEKCFRNQSETCLAIIKP
jgi:hypothetical protein